MNSNSLIKKQKQTNKQTNKVKIEFQYSIIKLSFLRRITDIRIVWINTWSVIYGKFRNSFRVFLRIFSHIFIIKVFYNSFIVARLLLDMWNHLTFSRTVLEIFSRM